MPTIYPGGPEGYISQAAAQRRAINNGLKIAQLQAGKSYTFAPIAVGHVQKRAFDYGIRVEYIHGIGAIDYYDKGFRVLTPPAPLPLNNGMSGPLAVQVELLKGNGTTQREYIAPSGQKFPIIIWYLPEIAEKVGGRRRRTGVKKTRGGRKKTRRSK